MNTRYDENPVETFVVGNNFAHLITVNLSTIMRHGCRIEYSYYVYSRGTMVVTCYMITEIHESVLVQSIGNLNETFFET